MELVEFKAGFWERILELTSSTSSNVIYNKFYDKFQQVVQVVYILAAAHSDLASGRSRDHVDLNLTCTLLPLISMLYSIMSTVDGRNLAPVYAPPDPPSTQC